MTDQMPFDDQLVYVLWDRDRLRQENEALRAALQKIYLTADAPGDDIRATATAALGFAPNGEVLYPNNPKPQTYEAAMMAYEGACRALSRALHDLAIAQGE